LLPANVSIRTVTRVLNDEPLVNKKTRLAVQKVISETGFKPNLIARSLRTGSTNFIGFIIPDTVNPSFTEFVRGATDFFDTYNYHIIICSTDDNLDKEISLIKDFSTMWIAGMLIVPTITENRDKSIFDSVSWPIVIVDREISGLNRDLVKINNFDGAYRAVKYLIDLGHKKIAVIAGLKSIKDSIERYKGWEKAMKEKQLYRKDLINWGENTTESGKKITQYILKKHKDIDAIFACSDVTAFGSIQAIEENGFKIPEDISLIGFDDTYISRFLRPPLTAVHYPLYETGKKAAEILLNRIIDHTNIEPIKIVLNCDLTIRDSVARKK
ncbi:MAG: LacI family transcriptional regulator, partial [Actinobacteria bacterium]|nr:LacI family transcriptional regulator [Actinomycetota bacterium]